MSDLISRQALLEEIYGSNRPKIYNRTQEVDWIPCKDRLPEEKEGCRDICQMEKVGDDINIYPVDTEHFKASDEVLVTVIDLGDGHVFPSVDNIVNGKWQTYEGDLWKVLAWMPLPEPYREKSLKEENHEY